MATHTDSQLITAGDIVAGNAHDSETATALVEVSEANTGNLVEAAIGDRAFGTAEVREQLETRSTQLVANVPCFSATAKGGLPFFIVAFQEILF